MVWSSVVSAGGNLLGGLLGMESESRSRNANSDLNEQMINFQREMAQHGIRYRVDDAKAAGIHPLYALGAPVFSGSPAVVGDTPGMSAANMAVNLGQDLSRAIDATRTAEERVDARADAIMDLQLKRGQLENDLLAAQIAKTYHSMNPPFPSGDEGRLIPGQSPVAVGSRFLDLPAADQLKAEIASERLPGYYVDTKPMERQASDPGRPWQEAGAVSDIGHAKSRTGHAPVYSGDVKQRLEDDFLGMLAWNFRNRLLPSLGFNHNPPREASPGMRWVYDVLRQEYREVPVGPYRGNSIIVPERRK